LSPAQVAAALLPVYKVVIGGSLTKIETVAELVESRRELHQVGVDGRVYAMHNLCA
jgi:hypothetical protein